MTPQEKAIELVDYFKRLVYPFIGSSMLTNEEHPPTILKHAKICALKVVEEIHLEWMDRSDDYTNDCRNWWTDVKTEIENIETPTP